MGARLKQVGQWSAYFVVRCLVAAIQVVSYERADLYAARLAKLLAWAPVRQKVVNENLLKVMPHLTAHQLFAFREAMWKNLILMVCEIAWAPRRLHRTNWKQHVTIANKTAMLGPMLDARPLVMVTGHYGNFEIANYITGLFGLSTTAVARPLDNPFINDYFLRLRESKGQHMVSKDGSATDIDNHLKNNGVLTILADQYAGLKGCWVSFLGQPSSCHKSLALFTLIAGAPLLVVANRRVGRPMQFELDWFGTADPRQPGSHLDGMRELTGWYNERLAQAIARSPEQYWWLHRRWRNIPPPKSAKLGLTSSGNGAGSTDRQAA